MIKEITGIVFKDMVINAAAVLEQEKQHINELNVFPVPDGDTGTNMSLTINAGVAELKKSSAGTIGKVAEITANALLRGARGNSGVILSLLFRGISKALKGVDKADTLTFSKAMNEGVTAAYNAVMKPAEGTILTVSRISSAAAVDIAADEEDFDAFFSRIIAVGSEALENTVNQNPILKKAGVVDAGGKGYLCILNGMLLALRGEMIEISNTSSSNQEANFSDFRTEDITFTYCTEFIIRRETQKSPNVLRDFLSGIGDSIVVVDDEEIIKVHVHTNDPGNVLTKALTFGSLLTVKIENMREQHTNKIIEETTEEVKVDETIVPAEKKYGVVAVCAGDGMASVFQELGVDGVITGGQTMNPSTESILQQINLTPSEIVYVLPNNKNIIMAAEQCISLTEKKVIVIPSKTVPQGITAMLNFDPDLEESDCTAALTSSLGNVHTALITYAARDSEFDGHSIRAGEYLALLEGALIANDSDFNHIISAISDALQVFSPEFLTIYYGEDVNLESADSTLNCFKSTIPNAEITLISGGQPVYYYMLSAE